MANKLNATGLKVFVNTGLSLFILRFLAASSLFYHHGLAKLTSVLAGNFPPHFDPLGLGAVVSFTLAAFAEGICTLFMMIGFYTRLSALFLVINFIVAYYAASKEAALLYLIFFVAIFLLGPGKFSLDAKR